MDLSLFETVETVCDGRGPAITPLKRGGNEIGLEQNRNCLATARFGWLLGLAVFLLGIAGCGRNSQREVVVYASQDQVYAESILAEFTRRSGIRVRAVYDSEAIKTVALTQRLLQEKGRPQCDVFWNNEALRTHQLAARGVVEQFAPFGSRSRRIVVNTNTLSLTNASITIHALTNQQWRGKIALAYPLFGSTATHFLALRQHWGPAAWETWCKALRENKPLLLEGNSMVVRFVGRGEAVIGLTDSDDIAAGQREGLPIAPMPLTEELLLIPNTVAIIRGAPHPAEARELFAFLQSAWVEEQLIRAGAMESAPAVGAPSLPVDWGALLRDLEAATDAMRKIFVR